MKNINFIVLSVFCLVLCTSCGSGDADSPNQIKYMIADWEVGPGNNTNILKSDSTYNAESQQCGSNTNTTSAGLNVIGDRYLYFAGYFRRDGSSMLGYRLETYSVATTEGTSFNGVNTLQFDYRYSGETGAKVYLCMATGDSNYKDIFTNMNINTATLINDNAWHTISIPLDSGFSSTTSSTYTDVIGDLGFVVIMIYSTDNTAPSTQADIYEFAIDDVILRN